MLENKLLILTFVVCVLLDQITKLIVLTNINLQGRITLIKDFFSLTNVRNYGAAYSILNGGRYILIIVSIIFCYLLYKYVIEKETKTKYNQIIYGMLYGGIIGNLLDRLFRGYVVDYLDFIIFKYDFPVFNLADTLIVITMILIVFKMMWGDKNESNN